MKASWIGMGIAVVALGLVVSPAGATNLTMSVQLQSGQSAMVDHTGQVISLNVYATLAGTGGASDGVQFLQGSLMSSPGGLLGDLAFTLNSSFTGGTGASSGTQQDLDADTDKDVGNVGPQSSAAGFIWAGAPTGIFVGDASESVLIGTATFTVTDLNPLGKLTDVSWVFRNKTGLGSSTNQYKIGASTFTVAGNNANLATSPLTIGIPEPVTMAVLALGGLGLLLRRKRSA